MVRDRVKFRVGSLVWVAFSRDERVMGFAFPKEERDALIESAPNKFALPHQSDLRYNWVVADLDQLGVYETEELLFDAWTMVVPKKVVAEVLAMQAHGLRQRNSDESVNDSDPERM